MVLLTEQEWTARMKKKEPQDTSPGKKGAGSSSSPKKQRRGKRGGQGCSGEGSSGKDGGAPAASRDRSSVRCFNCDNYGHYAKECRKPRRERRQEAHVAEAQEEPVLLLATASAMVTTAAPGTIVLDEPHAQLHVGRHEQLSPDRWFLDTGASNHMSGRREFFTDLDDTVRFGDGSVIDICGFGDVTLECYNGAHRIVSGVYYIPKLKSNLISLGQLDENDCAIHIEDGVMTIRDRARALVAKVTRTEGRSYLLDLKVAQPVCLAASCEEVPWLWHARYGHLNFGSLRRLAQGAMVRGLPDIEQVDRICNCCQIAKQRRAPFPSEAKYRATEPLELVHGDLCGPISPATPGGKRHLLLLVDDMSRYMWVVLLGTKDQAPAAIRDIQAKVKLECGRKLKVLRTDRGGGVNSPRLNLVSTAQGMACDVTSPRPIRRSRMVLLNGEIRRSWQWRGVC